MIDRRNELVKEYNTIQQRLSNPEAYHLDILQMKRLEDKLKVVLEEYRSLGPEVKTESPIYLETVKSFENTKKAIQVRRLADRKSKLYLFENTDYPKENSEVIMNEDGTPKEIIYYKHDSSTCGVTEKHIIPILLDQPEPEQPKPEIKKREPNVIPSIGRFLCSKCGHENYHNGDKCLVCGTPRIEQNRKKVLGLF